MSVGFEDPDLHAALDGLDADGLDRVGFGVIRLDAAHTVIDYNRAEQELSGLPPEQVEGRHFFTMVAPCTDNAMVAGRFATGADRLDETLDYVFTMRMRPTPVRLRLLADEGSPHRYVVVQRR